MNISEMTDFEIDAAVAAIMHPGLKITNFAGEAVVWFGNLETRVVRYCNSWSDAGPIIERERITITSALKRDWWDAIDICAKIEHRHSNPLRAAMIVFLMMRGKQESPTDNYRQIENDGWIEWGGGACPVKYTAQVAVKFRDRSLSSRHAGGYSWEVYGSEKDIIAYRVIENDGREG